MTENLDKIKKRSTKKSKKKHSEKIVESVIEVNNAALEEALPTIKECIEPAEHCLP